MSLGQPRRQAGRQAGLRSALSRSNAAPHPARIPAARIPPASRGHGRAALGRPVRGPGRAPGSLVPAPRRQRRAALPQRVGSGDPGRPRRCQSHRGRAGLRPGGAGTAGQGTAAAAHPAGCSATGLLSHPARLLPAFPSPSNLCPPASCGAPGSLKLPVPHRSVPGSGAPLAPGQGQLSRSGRGRATRLFLRGPGGDLRLSLRGADRELPFSLAGLGRVGREVRLSLEGSRQGSWLSLRRTDRVRSGTLLLLRRRAGRPAVPQGTEQGARLSPGSPGRRRRRMWGVSAATPRRLRPAGSIAIAGLLSSHPLGAFLGCRDVSVVRDE